MVDVKINKLRKHQLRVRNYQILLLYVIKIAQIEFFDCAKSKISLDRFIVLYYARTDDRNLLLASQVFEMCN